MCFNHGHSHNVTVVDAPKMTTQKVDRRNVVKSLAAGSAAMAVTACATNPETGRKQFLALAPSETALSQTAAASWDELRSSTPTSNDPRYTNRLQTIGNRISRGAGRADEQWDYTVFDQDTLNAFVLPGNRVGLYKGMMDFADNDDQIANIMGHEVGHVAGAHARERFSTQVGTQLGVTAASVAISSRVGRKCDSVPANQRSSCLNASNRNAQLAIAALGLGAQFGILLPYSRRHETESDLLGANYAQRAGYDPYEGVRLWEKMAARNANRPPEFLSTHPDPANRARTLHNYIKRQEDLGSQGFKDIRT